MGAHLQLHRRKLTLDNIDPRKASIDMVDEMLSIVEINQRLMPYAY